MVVHTNDNSAWRAFEESELTHSAAHYLMTIMHLRKKNGYARVTDVAEHLSVSRGAASRGISLFKERGWIQENEHRMLELTDDGMELARSVERNYLILEFFFEDILGVPDETSREDACKIEHLLSPETSKRLFRFIRIFRDHPELTDQVRKQFGQPDSECCQKECDICEEYDGCLAEDTRNIGQPTPPAAE
jgi:Mn-dependent DtxR family transcriptional regulator